MFMYLNLDKTLIYVPVDTVSSKAEVGLLAEVGF